MDSDELSSRRFGNLDEDFIVPPYHSNEGNGPNNPRNPNGPNGPPGPPGINGGGRGPSGDIYPYNEYTTLPIHRMLT
jgi:hypothetical protein